MFKRRLGKSGIEVSAMGLGTNAIGGLSWDPAFRKDLPASYGNSDDRQALEALERALDLGINFFDTADSYGCGHSERLLGQALAGRRDRVIISTKFGHTFDERARTITGEAADPAYICQACEESLRRLNTDYIDLYFLHLKNVDLDQAALVRDTLEELVSAGKIRFYGWSTDDVERARFFAVGAHCTAVQHRLNIMMDNPEMLALCEANDLASINRIPLAMGVLTGKYTAGTRLPQEDMRSEFWRSEAFLQDLERIAGLRDVLTRRGHSYPQAALAWIWARHERTIPIPGFRNRQQVEENVAAMDLDLLDGAQMAEIERRLGRTEEDHAG